MLNFNSTVVNTEIIPAVQKVVPIKVSAPKIPTANIRVRISDIIVIIGWLVWIAFCTWYTYTVVDNYLQMQNTPTTALSFNETTALEFPGITICNYHGRQSTSNYCPECDLILKEVFRLTVTGTYTSNLGGEIQTEKTQVTDNLSYTCYKINNDPSKLFIAKKKGISGSVSFLFEIPTVNTLSINGLQVTFHEPGSTPSVYQETQFASPGAENYFSLTKVVRTVLDMNYDTSLAIRNVSFDSAVSTIAVTDLPSNNVLVTVTYGTMSVYNIDEVLTNTIPSLLGDIAGMIGLTMGLDLLKICRGLLEIPYAIKAKTIKNIWKIFN